MERNGEVTFFVPGFPISKGSAKAFMRKGMKHPVVMQDNNERQRPWASAIGYAAQQTGVELVSSGPVALGTEFHMPRPASHYRSGNREKGLKVTAPHYHTKTPDLDKLVRCVKDAMTGIVWRDDSQVAMLINPTKIYSDTPGVRITLKKL